MRDYCSSKVEWPSDADVHDSMPFRRGGLVGGSCIEFHAHYKKLHRDITFTPWWREGLITEFVDDSRNIAQNVDGTKTLDCHGDGLVHVLLRSHIVWYGKEACASRLRIGWKKDCDQRLYHSHHQHDLSFRIGQYCYVYCFPILCWLCACFPVPLRRFFETDNILPSLGAYMLFMASPLWVTELVLAKGRSILAEITGLLGVIDYIVAAYVGVGFSQQVNHVWTMASSNCAGFPLLCIIY